jgi:hypothetical protein|tara:strand:- start:465 stop:653 length:189 start_codon:yes stop_codon:yes gene_type:complete
MLSNAEIELHIRQLEEAQHRRLEELASNDPVWQKARGALEAFRATYDETDDKDETEKFTPEK